MRRVVHHGFLIWISRSVRCKVGAFPPWRLSQHADDTAKKRPDRLEERQSKEELGESGPDLGDGRTEM